jgi:hypothetical protein
MGRRSTRQRSRELVTLFFRLGGNARVAVNVRDRCRAALRKKPDAAFQGVKFGRLKRLENSPPHTAEGKC